MLVEFSRALLNQPKLIGGTLPPGFESKLRDDVLRLDRLNQPHPMHIGASTTQRAAAYEAVRANFTRLELSVLRLEHHVVNLLTQGVTSTGRGKKIGDAQFEILRLLIDAPSGLTIAQVAEKLGVELDAATARMMRLKRQLEPDLYATRRGNVRRYALHRARDVKVIAAG